MHILALEAYCGGSHRAFLDGWSSRSRHQWTVLTLPPYKWKWRMRHSAITFAEQVSKLVAQGQRWEAVFCSDMLNLAEFLGLVGDPVRSLPRVAYFHENQLTYPVRHESERDWHFAFTNLTTALSATRVWFNSGFHRDEFLGAARTFLRRMPDHQPSGAIDQIRGKSDIQYPGIDVIERPVRRTEGPLRILWAARWEHDKNPEAFFSAIKELKNRGVDFRISVIGEQFRDSPAVFDQAQATFADQIDHWGYLPSRFDYERALVQADVVVSTADHEFFGIGVVEAAGAGAVPLLPLRLAYPEVFATDLPPNESLFFCDGTPEGLADRLEALARQLGREGTLADLAKQAVDVALRYSWDARVEAMDNAMSTLVGNQAS